jgi:phosphoglycolate phosphatase
MSRALLAELKDDPVMQDKVRTSFKRFYALGQTVSTRPYPGLEELLTRLKNEGYRMGVWSNKDEDNARFLIDRYFPGVFTSVIGAVPGRPIKPEPQAGQALASLLRASPGDIIYLGDSEVDMETAKNCGVIPIGVGWGFRESEVLAKAGARVVLSNPADLFQYLGGSHGQH